MIQAPSLLLALHIGAALSMASPVMPHNRRPGLLPPPGTGWRGGEIGALNDPVRGHDPELYREKYGYPMHVLRIFVGEQVLPSVESITPSIRSFVSNGGILWYNLAPSNWESVPTGALDAALHRYAADLKSLEPALVYSCIFHEPDHNLDPASGRTPDAYRAMWVYVQDKFKELGVTNVVWAMDFSVKISDFSPEQDSKNVMTLWPGADRIDWVFFNVFEHTNVQRTGADFNAIVGKIVNFLEDHSTSECVAGGQCGFTSKPWGIGAFGTTHEVADDLQVNFLQEAIKSLDLKQFPRLRAHLYYDARDSAITDNTMPDYKTFLGNDYFCANDNFAQQGESILYA